jgi:hypothetical protein
MQTPFRSPCRPDIARQPVRARQRRFALPRPRQLPARALLFGPVLQALRGAEARLRAAAVLLPRLLMEVPGSRRQAERGSLPPRSGAP